MDSMHRDTLLPISDLGAVQASTERSGAMLLNLALEHADDKAGVLEQVEVTDAALDERFAAYTATDMTGREEARDAFIAALAQWRQARDTQLVPLALQGATGPFQDANEVVGTPVLIEALVHLEGLKEIERDAGP